jgi:spermidine/putrescine transport system permease protein
MNRLLKLHLVAVYGFLFVPIAVLVVLSFNRSGLPTTWGGFSTKWYGELADNGEIREGLRNTLVVATGATVLATILGTLLAVGIQRYVRNPLLEAALNRGGFQPLSAVAVTARCASSPPRPTRPSSRAASSAVIRS